VQRTEHVRVACWRLATADTDWLVAFAWAATADRRSAAQPVRWGPESDLERCRAHQDSAARWAQDDERASGGEAEKRRRIPACQLPRFAFHRTAARPMPNKRKEKNRRMVRRPTFRRAQRRRKNDTLVTSACRCTNPDSRCTTTRGRPRCPLSRSGLSRFLLPTFLCGMQRKVGAAPHRGNANRPLPIQGKANTLRTLTISAEQAKTSSASAPDNS